MGKWVLGHHLPYVSCRTPSCGLLSSFVLGRNPGCTGCGEGYRKGGGLWEESSCSLITFSGQQIISLQ